MDDASVILLTAICSRFVQNVIKVHDGWQKEGTVGSMTGVERGMKLLRGDNILKVIDPPVPGTLA